MSRRFILVVSMLGIPSVFAFGTKKKVAQKLRAVKDSLEITTGSSQKDVNLLFRKAFSLKWKLFEVLVSKNNVILWKPVRNFWV